MTPSVRHQAYRRAGSGALAGGQLLSGGSGGGAERQLSANLGSVGSARASSEEASGLANLDMDRLQLAQARRVDAGFLGSSGASSVYSHTATCLNLPAR